MNSLPSIEKLETMLSNVKCECDGLEILKLLFNEIVSLKKICTEVLKTVQTQQKDDKNSKCMMTTETEAFNNLRENNVKSSESNSTMNMESANYDADNNDADNINENPNHDEQPHNTVLLEKILAAQGTMLEEIRNVRTDQLKLEEKCHQNQEKTLASLGNVTTNMESSNLNLTKALEGQSDKLFEFLKQYETKQEVFQKSIENLTTCMESIDLKSTELPKKNETSALKLKTDQLMENNTNGIINIPEWMDSEHIALIDSIKKSYPDEFFLLFPNCLNFNGSKDVKDIIRKNCHLSRVCPFIETSPDILAYLNRLLINRIKLLELVKDKFLKFN